MTITRLDCSSENHQLFTDGNIMYFGQSHELLSKDSIAIDNQLIRPGVRLAEIGRFGKGAYLRSKTGHSFEFAGFAENVLLAGASTPAKLMLFRNKADGRCTLQGKASKLGLSNLFFALFVSHPEVEDINQLDSEAELWILDHHGTPVHYSPSMTLQ